MAKRPQRAAKARKAPHTLKATPSTPAPGSDAFNRIRGVNTAFCRAVPAPALATGAFDVRAARESNPTLQIGPDLRDVDDGFYRVEGSDWILTVGGGELVEVQKARGDLDYHNLVKVPSQ